ncbi:HAD-IIIA family hydrolase [Candidatus Babeliales bacterium]|nr:HAD-IIIA family hydrolase [Candidatus Babeliales bacterium]MCF7899868.1 HAD-IIIA family hydrolase [Candidatus Babeliales bacterium]
MNKAVFIDRDGTINKIVLRDNKPAGPRFFKEFELLFGIKESLEKLKENNYLLILVTNQPDIARKKMSIFELNKITNFIKQELCFDEILICPHDTHDNCGCRKSKPGMIFYAATKFDIDVSKSFVIGDSDKDMLAAQNACCPGILIDTVYNQNFIYKNRVKNFKTAVNLILEKC